MRKILIIPPVKDQTSKDVSIEDQHQQNEKEKFGAGFSSQAAEELGALTWGWAEFRSVDFHKTEIEYKLFPCNYQLNFCGLLQCDLQIP